MRGTIRIPLHAPTLPREPPSGDPEVDEDKFIGRPCYAFNGALRTTMDDTRCEHCRHYLTARCPHIDEFLDDVEDLSPE